MFDSKFAVGLDIAAIISYSTESLKPRADFNNELKDFPRLKSFLMLNIPFVGIGDALCASVVSSIPNMSFLAENLVTKEHCTPASVLSHSQFSPTGFSYYITRTLVDLQYRFLLVITRYTLGCDDSLLSKMLANTGRH